MRVHFTRHLLVTDKGEMVGIISMRDVIRLMLDEKQWLIDELQIYITGRQWTMKVAVLKEIVVGEKRVSAVPATVEKRVPAGMQDLVQTRAGLARRFVH